MRAPRSGGEGAAVKDDGLCAVACSRRAKKDPDSKLPGREALKVEGVVGMQGL